MSRFEKAKPVLKAAETWKQRCLLDSLSLLGDEQLWTVEHFGELQTYFVERPDEGSGTFEEKLRRQLEPATQQSKRLWAELTWLFFLIAISLGREKKLDRIRTIWELSGDKLPKDHWALGDVLDGGIVNPGPAYLIHQWREFSFIITMMNDWCTLPVGKRQGLLNDPWRFAEWVEGQKEGRIRQFRHALLYLIFPDSFESIVVSNHKKAILRAFREDQDNISNIKSMGLIDLDQALLIVRDRLQTSHGEEEIHYYLPPWKQLWRRDGEASGDSVHADDPAVASWHKNRFGKADLWVIGAGEGARFWEEFHDSSIAAIGWDELGDLSEYDSKEAMHSALIEIGAGKNPSMISLAVWEFAREIKQGDIFIAKKGRTTILGWGKVRGDYSYEADRAEYQHLRKVDWFACPKPITLKAPITTKTLTRFTRYKHWLRDLFTLIDADEEEPQIESDDREGTHYDSTTALTDLFMEEAEFHRILDSIARHKNLILQGPPGVGKTFIARRIAWCLRGRKNSKSVEMVQFHQSYAYEDFVQGWRPTETGGFTLRNGVFYEFCNRAEERPQTKFVFIIDEINRGNLSRIFGELLMLIEEDKRGPKHAIALTYGKREERFSVPENVYLLGLMNTADRSLAIVDYALRRRFAFHTLQPAYGTQKFRDHLIDAEVDHDLIDRIDENLLALNEQICTDKDLGPGFQIGHSYFVPKESADEQWFLGIVNTQIKPLLLEYWFDHPENVDRLIENLLG